MLYSNINVISHHSLHKKLLEELDGQGYLNKIMYHPKRRACRRYLYAGCKGTQWWDHSPPQKASEITGKSGPTVQHLHRQPLPICTLSRCGTLYEWLFSLYIPTISTRVDFLFSVNYYCLCIHQKLFYFYYIYVLTCYCHLFSIVVSYSWIRFWKNCMVRADCATPPSPATTNLYVISFFASGFSPLPLIWTYFIVFSSSIPTISTRVYFLFSSTLLFFIHAPKKQLYIYYIYVSHLFSVVVS